MDGKTNQTPRQKRINSPCSLPALPLLANSEVIRCMVQTNSFPKAMLHTKRLCSNMQLNVAFLNRSGHTEHDVNKSLQDFSKSSAE